MKTANDPFLDYEILLGFVFATAALAISPGPDNIFVLTLSMANGKKYGLAVVAGLMTGCLVHTTLLAFGVSEVIKRSETLFWVIKLFGAAYLMYLAFMVFREGSGIELSQGNTTELRLTGLFKKGFWMNVLNPKVTIFFLAFFPAFLFSDSLNPVIQFYTLGFLFIMVSALIFGGMALMAGSISVYISRTPKVSVFFKWLQIVVFVGIAVYLLVG
ncbi:LysE family translocator [Flavobacteriaceae bacterium GF1]